MLRNLKKYHIIHYNMEIEKNYKKRFRKVWKNNGEKCLEIWKKIPSCTL